MLELFLGSRMWMAICRSGSCSISELKSAGSPCSSTSVLEYCGVVRIRMTAWQLPLETKSIASGIPLG